MGRFFDGNGCILCLGIAHINPGKFAQPDNIKPGAKQRKPEQGLGLILERRQLLAQLVYGNQPGFIMLRPLQGKAVSTLLGERFLGNVHGEFEPLGLHGKKRKLRKNTLRESA